MPRLNEHQWMIVHWVTISPVAIGFLMSLWALHETYCRKKRVEHAMEDGVAHTTMNRAVRNEVIFSLVHFKLLVLSLWAVFVTTSPEAPGNAHDFYVASYVGRMLVSCLLILASVMDYRDRRVIARALDRQHPGTKSQVG